MRTSYSALLKKATAFACCVAAIYSFLGSSFFGVLAQWLTVTFETEGIPILLGLDLGTFMKFGLLLIIGVYAISVVFSEKDGDYGGLLIYCLTLFLPEALSLSKINYLNAAGLAPFFVPTRDSWAVLFTGLVIIQAYILNIVIGNSADYSEKYLSLGADPKDVEEASGGQMRFVVLFGLLSIAALLAVVAITSQASSVLSGFMSELPLRHVVYGALGVAIVVITLVLASPNRKPTPTVPLPDSKQRPRPEHHRGDIYKAE